MSFRTSAERVSFERQSRGPSGRPSVLRAAALLGTVPWASGGVGDVTLRSSTVYVYICI